MYSVYIDMVVCIPVVCTYKSQDCAWAARLSFLFFFFLDTHRDREIERYREKGVEYGSMPSVLTCRACTFFCVLFLPFFYVVVCTSVVIVYTAVTYL